MNKTPLIVKGIGHRNMRPMTATVPLITEGTITYATLGYAMVRDTRVR
jgi:hypothetical protein